MSRDRETERGRTMIKADRGEWVAGYVTEGGVDDEEWAEIATEWKPVIAWDDEGFALVVDGSAGRLVRAGNLKPRSGEASESVGEFSGVRHRSELGGVEDEA